MGMRCHFGGELRDRRPTAVGSQLAEESSPETIGQRSAVRSSSSSSVGGMTTHTY
jgi:hypothetical protein